jgi:hypothetical protein
LFFPREEEEKSRLSNLLVMLGEFPSKKKSLFLFQFDVSVFFSLLEKNIFYKYRKKRKKRCMTRKKKKKENYKQQNCS